MMRLVSCLKWQCIPVALLCITYVFIWPGVGVPSVQAKSHIFSFAPKSTGHATIIVLDMSGSMGTNDPNGLRCSAANAYIDLSGVDDYIGIVGLNNSNGQRGGDHNFQTAEKWSDPLSTGTQQNKDQLKNAIASNSGHHCNPRNTTPTYDALYQAYNMLVQITQHHNVGGSVILLTDGTPSPDTDAQIAAIKKDLIPLFQSSGWHIDTVGLGQDAPVGGSTPGTFHDFLSGIASSTGGSFFDDGHGPVQGISPLNIAPFFAQIFAQYSGRVLNKDVPPTALDGGTIQRNFRVIDGTTHLDVIVVKDRPDITVSLLDPNNQLVSSDGVGVFVSPGDYNVIYSIDGPTAGLWTVSVTGSTGQFLLDSIKQTNVGLSVTSVKLKNSNLSGNNVFPLGQPIEVKANLTEGGTLLTDSSFSVSGNMTFSGGEQDASYPFKLFDNATPGIYVGDVTVPTSAPAGTYIVQLTASTVTVQNAISVSNQSVRLEIFPIPSFFVPHTKQPVLTPISVKVVQWPSVPFWIYTLPGLDRLSGWPLQNLPADAHTELPGELQWQGNVYPGATITATAQKGNDKPLPVTIISNGQGYFTAEFKPPSSGRYTITFLTSGSFKDSHGGFGTTQQDVIVNFASATTDQMGFAAFITGVYALIAFLLYNFLRFLIWTPQPFGEWVVNRGTQQEGRRSFRRARRLPNSVFFRRNVVYSREAGMPKGLVFKFFHGKRIEAKPNGPTGGDWQSADGSRLRRDFQRVQELVYRPRNEAEAGVRYHIVAEPQKKGKSGYGGYGGYGSYDGSKSGKSKGKAKANSGSSFNDMFGSPRKQSKQSKKRRGLGKPAPWEMYE